jgi:hypothetical protein
MGSDYNCPSASTSPVSTHDGIICDKFGFFHECFSLRITVCGQCGQYIRRHCSATIQSIVVKVSATLTPASLANNLAAVTQGFANQANVPASSVVVVVSNRRLFAEEQAPETESFLRRLQSDSVQVQASITADNSTDVIAAAKSIHAAVSNSTALASSIGNTTQTTVTAQASVSFQVSVQAVITTSGGATVNATAVTASVASGFNGTAVLTSFTSDAPTTAAPVTTAAPAVTTSVSAKKSDSHAPRSAGCIFVAFMSVLLAVKFI